MSEIPSVSAHTDHPEPTDTRTKLRQAFAVDRDWSLVSKRVGRRTLLGAGAAVMLNAVGLSAFRAAYGEKIYPSIYVGDVNVGGMTIPDALAAVEKRAKELNSSSVRFHYQNQTWTPTLAELGVHIDAADSVERAAAMGRDGQAADRAAFAGSVLDADQRLPLAMSLDPWIMEQWLDQVDTDIADPAINAKFEISGTDLTITPDATGIVADRDAAKSMIISTLETFAPIDDELPTVVDQPSVTATDLEANRKDIIAIVSSPVPVQFEDVSWEVKPEEVTPFMIFTSDMVNGSAQTHVDFDRKALGRYLSQTYAEKVNRTPIDATVAFADGGLYATSESVAGKTILPDEFAAVVADSFLGNHVKVDVPVLTTAPRVDSTNLGALGIVELIGRGDSNFAGGSAERANNIVVGAHFLNGALVAPGEMFSFNGKIGAITEDKGYVGGQGIVAGIIQDEFGGGICQVSTTCFRAALMGGFPIPMWYPHTYRLKGYEADGWGPGFDASILQVEWMELEEWPDLRFKNATDNWILVQSWIAGEIHVVEIYGTNPQWDVQISEPSTWEVGPGEDRWVVDASLPAGSITVEAYPLDGLGVQFHRTVTGPGGTVISDADWPTYFQARGYQYKCSPDMEGVKP